MRALTPRILKHPCPAILARAAPALQGGEARAADPAPDLQHPRWPRLRGAVHRCRHHGRLAGRRRHLLVRGAALAGHAAVLPCCCAAVLWCAALLYLCLYCLCPLVWYPGCAIAPRLLALPHPHTHPLPDGVLLFLLRLSSSFTRRGDMAGFLRRCRPDAPIFAFTGACGGVEGWGRRGGQARRIVGAAGRVAACAAQWRPPPSLRPPECLPACLPALHPSAPLLPPLQTSRR